MPAASSNERPEKSSSPALTGPLGRGDGANCASSLQGPSSAPLPEGALPLRSTNERAQGPYASAATTIRGSPGGERATAGVGGQAPTRWEPPVLTRHSHPNKAVSERNAERRQ